MNPLHPSIPRYTLQGGAGAYEVTVGLEVHAQITSRSKLFSSASTAFGGMANENVDFIDAAFPGMLPVLNQHCVLQALKTSLGLSGRINHTSYFDRKSYFYPDLPQGYQISQFYTPLMEEGHLAIETKTGLTKVIGIERLHIEQDAGKSLHDVYADSSAVDLNRAGVGLMEIVTKPEITSPEEAALFVKKLRSLVVYLGTCSGNMEEGNLRVDANVSVALPKNPLGTRVEIKNLNSVRFMQQAIASEGRRQIALIESGQPIVQETRLFDAAQKVTLAMRKKEDAQQYRYFPDPDLPPLYLEPAFVEEIKATLPELPDAKKQRFQKQFGLSAYDAGIVLSDMAVALFFEKAVVQLKKAAPKLLVNWLMGDVMAALNRENKTFNDVPFTAEYLVALVEMVADGRLSGKMAKEVFEAIWLSGESPEVYVAEKGLVQISSEEALSPFITEVLRAEAEKVQQYKAGKEKLFGYFVGCVMKKTSGKAHPELLNKMLTQALSD